MSFVIVFLVALYFKYTQENQNLAFIIAMVSIIFIFVIYLIIVVIIGIYVYRDCTIRHIRLTKYIILSLLIIGFVYYLLRRDELSY